jgi:hypothetical protein
MRRAASRLLQPAKPVQLSLLLLPLQVSVAFGGSLNILVNNVGTNIRKPTADFTDEVRCTRACMWRAWLAAAWPS